MITKQLYEALTKQLKKAKEPVSCQDLLDTFEVRQMEDVDLRDVSNALGALWRSGKLERFEVQSRGRGPRFSYMLKPGGDAKHAPVPNSVNIDKLDIKQQADGSVQITTNRLMITVKPFNK